jgi:hypothetical protein
MNCTEEGPTRQKKRTRPVFWVLLLTVACLFTFPLWGDYFWGGVGYAVETCMEFWCDPLSPSREQIGETVKTSMQQKFDSDAQFKEWHLTVTKVQVLKQAENRYQGIATVMHEGEPRDVPVDITADGSNVMWQAQAGAFMFVTQKEMQKLRSVFQ